MNQIIRKYLEDKASKAEKEDLYDWIHEDEANLAIFKEETCFFMLNLDENIKINSKRSFKEFKHAIQTKPYKINKSINFRTHYKYAAILIVLISSFFFAITSITLDQDQLPQSITNKSEERVNEVVIIEDDGTEKKLSLGQEALSYLEQSSSEDYLQHNVIKIPEGQTFKLTLSDSTVVWLNATSKLKYPKKFISALKTRSVELEGEAYFEVAHTQNRPFVVTTNGFKIKVVGTKFNVSSYPNDDNISTTLVDGSVKVGFENTPTKTLTPNEQASYSKKDNTLTTKRVNTSFYTSWMRNKIVFNDMPFDELEMALEKIYNIEVLNNNEAVKEAYFTGQFDVENIDAIFKALSTSIYFEYEINGNKVTIKK